MYVYCVRLKILYRKNFKDVQASNKKFITNNWKNIILHIFAYKYVYLKNSNGFCDRSFAKIGNSFGRRSFLKSTSYHTKTD